LAKRKEKTSAALLAFFGGWLGLHRFYLGQVGLGILYICFAPLAAIVSFVDGVVLLTQDEEKFDFKYNRAHLDINFRDENADFSRRRNEEKRRRREAKELAAIRAEEMRYRKNNNNRPSPKSSKSPLKNAHKLDGIARYKDFDFLGAIESFKKSLQIYYQDIAVHFNLACAYSISEEAENALFHLDKAVEYGFVDFKRIKDHDALAFLRIQPEYEQFAKNGYRLNKPEERKKVEPEIQRNIPESNNLLDQLKKLGELRDKGLLTDEEFAVQKQKLLR